MLEIHDLQKSFGDLHVLKGIDLNIQKGDVVAVLGSSGSGKTTLLRCINFLEHADAGTMTFDGQRVALDRITHAQIHALRRRTGFVFQNYNLFANKTALQNVTEGLIIARKMDKHQAETIARAIAYDPEILYFDEPTSALDPELTGEVLTVIRRLADEGRTMLVVTHEMDFARHVANRVVFMDAGVIVEQSDAEAFFTNPQQPRTREFLQNYKQRSFT